MRDVNGANAMESCVREGSSIMSGLWTSHFAQPWHIHIFFLKTGMCRFYCSICWGCPIQWSWDWCRNKGMKNFICEFCVIWFTSDCKFAERIEAVYAGRSINFKDFSLRFLDYGDGWRKIEVGSDSVGTLQKFIHFFCIKKCLLIYEPHL